MANFYALRRVSIDLPVSVGTASTLVAAANEHRKYLLIVNTSNQDFWIRLGTAAAVSTGLFVARNGFAYEIDNNNLWVGDVFAVHTGVGGTRVASVLELS